MGVIRFAKSLNTIHTGDVCRNVYASYYEPEPINIKFNTVTAFVTGMYHVLIIYMLLLLLLLLTLTFIQSHTDLNNENNKCSIILKLLT